jgi:hypothetical protein
VDVLGLNKCDQLIYSLERVGKMFRCHLGVLKESGYPRRFLDNKLPSVVEGVGLQNFSLAKRKSWRVVEGKVSTPKGEVLRFNGPINASPVITPDVIHTFNESSSDRLCSTGAGISKSGSTKSGSTESGSTESGGVKSGGKNTGSDKSCMGISGSCDKSGSEVVESGMVGSGSGSGKPVVLGDKVSELVEVCVEGVAHLKRKEWSRYVLMGRLT